MKHSDHFESKINKAAYPAAGWHEAVMQEGYYGMSLQRNQQMSIMKT